MTDEEIVNGLRRNEEAIIKGAYARFWAKVADRLRKEGMSSLDKKKIVYEEVFLRFWEKCQDTQFVCQNTDGYVLAIASNYLVEEYRANSGTTTQTVDVEAELPHATRSVTGPQGEEEEEEDQKKEDTPRVYQALERIVSGGKWKLIVRRFTLNDLLDALNNLKEEHREVLEKFYLEEPPVALRDIKILKADSNTEYRNYEDIKKLKQRAIAKLSQLLKTK